MKVSALLLMVAFALVAAADEPAWPADFWQQVERCVESSKPSGTQIAPSQESDFAPGVDWQASTAFGTAENPFDAIFRTREASEAVKFNSFPPVGFMLFLR